MLWCHKCESVLRPTDSVRVNYTPTERYSIALVMGEDALGDGVIGDDYEACPVCHSTWEFGVFDVPELDGCEPGTQHPPDDSP